MASSQAELTAKEKELFAYTQERNYDAVKRLVTLENVFVDCVDDDGMTPLQHAAYKGAYKICKLLLDCGADVNLSRHVSRYSALTFAGLSGRADVVRLLLEHEANPNSVNSINKTASQMAAFVGNHHVVSIINNFIPITKIHYFTQVQGLEREPRLPLEMATTVHQMAIMTNINPVRLALYIQANLSLIEHAKDVAYVFETLSKKYFHDEGNELLSLKFHHLGYVLLACEKFVNEQKLKATASASRPNKECLNPLIKHWIKGDINGFQVSLEKFLRKDVLAFPYVDCSLFQQLVTTLAPTKIGDEPSAISIVIEAVSGQVRSMDNYVVCGACGDPNAEKKCSACKAVQYCDKTCQKLHWSSHKLICSHLLKMNEDVKHLNLNSSPEGPEFNSNASIPEGACVDEQGSEFNSNASTPKDLDV